MLKLAKFQNFKKIDFVPKNPELFFENFFCYFFGKNTYFPAKYRKFSQFPQFQAFLGKKSKNLKYIRKKSKNKL